MKSIKYNDTDDYTYMSVLGQDGLYSPVRIDDKTMPEGFHRYELSPGKDTRFSAIGTKSKKGYAGDFISSKPLELKGNRPHKLTGSDWSMNENEKVDFQGFWGRKLSIDKQIANATHKRDVGMGLDPDSRDAHKAGPAEKEFEI